MALQKVTEAIQWVTGGAGGGRRGKGWSRAREEGILGVWGGGGWRCRHCRSLRTVGLWWLGVFTEGGGGVLALQEEAEAHAVGVE